MAEAVRPRHGHLWTSSEVARAFRVGVSSIKRWTDEGELETVRTEGGHRRYSLAALHRFASIRGLSARFLPPLEQNDLFDPIPPPADVTLLDALISADEEAVRSLVKPAARSILQRATFFDRVVGEALREIGDRWERGTLGVDQEHRASHMIAAALDRLRPPPAAAGRLALLACPPDEAHDMPLRLVRLILEWKGWQCAFAGAGLPWGAARHAVERASPALAAFSARSREPFEQPEFDEFRGFCEGRGTVVITGGHWARGGAGAGTYLRFRTLRGFVKWLT